MIYFQPYPLLLKKDVSVVFTQLIALRVIR